MKRKRLLFAIVALCSIVSVQAQKDVTSQYITNATLSDKLNGWTSVNFNTPQQGDNTTGYASESYAGWGNLDIKNYSLTQTITLPAGHYTLVNYSFFRYGLNADTDPSTSLAFLKAGENEVAIKTLGSITAPSYANSQKEGANAFDSKMYRNTVDFTIDANDTEIEIGLYGTFDLKQSWIIAGMFELINNDIPATMDSPFDVTGFLTNPGFEYRDMSGWTQSPEGFFQAQGNNQGFKVGGYYGEKWQSSSVGALPEGSMSQTLTGLIPGYYQLKANLGGNGTYINLNGKTANWTKDGDYTVGYVLSEGEDLTITAGKTAEGTANWIHFDNFKLFFCGDVAAALDATLAKVSDYEGIIPAAAFTALQTAVAEYDQSYSDVDELLAAIDAVEALYTDADALVDPYADWQTAKANAPGVLEEFVSGLDADVEAATTAEEINSAIESLNEKIAELEALQEVVEEYTVMKEYAQNLYDVADYTENEDGAHDALGTAITNNSGTFTTPEEYTAATAALKAAATTYAAKADPKGDAKFDLTFMLTNPDVTEFWNGVPGDPNSGTWGVQPEGWYNEQNGGNFQVMANPDMSATEIFMEYWSEIAANNGFVLCQKVTLPVGAYQMAGRVGVQQYDGKGTTTNVTFSANEVDGTQIPYGGLTDGSIEFINNAEQEVNIGLKAHAGNNTRWMGINNIHLYKIAPKAFIIDENATENIIAAGAGDVKLTRTIKVGMNSVVLPFQMTADDIVTLGGEGAVAYTVSEYANDNLKLAEATTIQPNVPFFLKATAAGTEFDFEGKTIAAEDPVVTVGDATLVGTYAKIDAVPEGSYILSGGKFYLVNSTVSLKPTRAYITIAEPTEVSALGFSFEDATAIVGVESETVNGEVYDIAGRKVSAPVRGLYIANGKKVLVK